MDSLQAFSINKEARVLELGCDGCLTEQGVDADVTYSKAQKIHDPNARAMY